MKRKFVSYFIFPLVILIVYFVITFPIVHNSRAYGETPQSKDIELIREVVKISRNVEADAAKTFDLSSFPLIFVNDQRGGELSSSTTDFIRSVSGDYSSKSFGYLDYKIAYYSWWKSGAIKIDALKSKALREKRDLTEDEIKSLFDDNGRMAMPRSQDFQTSDELQFITIEVESDIANVIFDDGLRTNKMILVKINNNWYIAGCRILSLHP